MRIPSYDDLTPSIPDISPSDVRTSVAALLPDGGPVASRVVAHPAATRQLYAALHGDPSIVEALVAIARDFSPRIERHPGGTVVVDVAGLQRLLGDPHAIAAELARAGVPRAAIAASQTAAILIARTHHGTTVATGSPEAALRDIPLAVLHRWLADREAPAALPAHGAARRSRQAQAAAAACARAFDVLRRWGLTTAGELAALPAPALSARLGAEGLAIQRLARGIDPQPLVPDPGVPRFVGSCELEWPIEALEPLSFVFARLLEPLAASLERADRGAVAMHLTLRLTDRSSHARTLQLPAAMRDPRVLRTLLLLDLESHPPPAAVDIVTIEVDPAPGRIVQYSLLERAVPSPETLATLMARLAALAGDGRCGSPVLLDTHRPDGFAIGPVQFGEQSSAAPHRDAPDASLPSSPPPPNRGSALRRFRPPVAVRVGAENGRPVRLAIDRRGMPGGVVTQAAGPWRTSGGWWEAGRWNRDEWDVALSDGSVCRVFRDRDTDGWFLDAVFD